MQLASVHGDIYRQLGVRPLINAAGTYTTLTGSLLVPQARDAMSEGRAVLRAADRLTEAVAARIAKLLDVPAAIVSSGGAGRFFLRRPPVSPARTEKIRRLPDTSGMKNEVVMVRSIGWVRSCLPRRRGPDHRSADGRSAEGRHRPKTAMLFWVNISEPKGKISAKEFLPAGKRAGVPVFNDAAAELPPADNLSALVKQGNDLVGFSGGKGLRGPQASGLLLGRGDLIAAAQLNNNPYSDTIARTCKVGKEEIMGLLAAVEVYREARSCRRHQALAELHAEHRARPRASGA